MQLAVLQDIEAAGLQPDDLSFTTLLSTMAESGQLRAYDDMMEYMRELGRSPSPRAMRQVIVRLAGDGQDSRLQEVHTHTVFFFPRVM
jgi:pentatricopeptide repeat protein